MYTSPKLIDHGTVFAKTMGNTSVASTKDGGSGLSIYAAITDGDSGLPNGTTASQTSGETRVN